LLDAVHEDPHAGLAQAAGVLGESGVGAEPLDAELLDVEMPDVVDAEIK
jgi:hypothetical protein